MITRILERRSVEDPRVPITEKQLAESLFGPPGSHGQLITEDTALRMAAVFACVKVISETIASLPIHVYRRLDDDSRERASDHPVSKLIRRPGEEMTMFTLVETAIGHLLTYGNAYLEKVLTVGGEVAGLVIWDPADHTVIVGNDGRKRLVDVASGRVVVPTGRLLHIAGLGYDGVIGYSPIRMMERTLGIAAASEEYGASFFGSGATVGGVLETPQVLKAEQAERLRNQFHQLYHGNAGRHRTLVLESGLQWKRIGLPPADAMFLESRKFSGEEVARIYRVPPHKIGILDKATFSNIEEQSLEFVTDTIRPWLVRVEQVLNWELFSERDRDSYYVEFKVDGLLRGNISTRYQAYSTAIHTGFMSRNEVRALENLDRVDGLDEMLVPINMADEMGDREGDSAQDEERAESRATERRALSLDSRWKIRDSFSKLFAAPFKRLARREADKILDGIARLEKGEIQPEEFFRQLERFYESYQDDFVGDFTGLVSAMGSLILREIELELGRESKFKDNLEWFSNEYTENLWRRRVGSSFGTLRDEIGELPFDEVRERVARRRDERPASEADDEATQAGAAMAREAYILAGIATLVWRANPGACGLCQTMDGKTAGIRESFLQPGETVEGDDEQTPIVNKKLLKHPPVHAGCRCGISWR